MKIVKEIKEQYIYLWWWLLENGLFISTLLVNTFLAGIFTVGMAILVLYLKWHGKH